MWELQPTYRSRLAELGRSAVGMSSQELYPPTGGSHDLTTEGPAQRYKGAKRRPREGKNQKSAAKGIVQAGTP